LEESHSQEKNCQPEFSVGIKEKVMSLDVLRERVQKAIARLEQLPDEDNDGLAEAVAECLNRVQEHTRVPVSTIDMSYELLETL
jgi:hypothetical protein